jgi:hypothetical protein
VSTLPRAVSSALIIFGAFAFGAIIWAGNTERPGPAIMLLGAALLSFSLTLARFLDIVAKQADIDSPYALLITGRVLNIAAGIAALLLVIGALNVAHILPWDQPVSEAASTAHHVPAAPSNNSTTGDATNG